MTTEPSDAGLPLPADIGKRLKKARHKAGVFLGTVSMTYPDISAIEHGRKRPTAEQLVDLAHNQYHTTVHALVCETASCRTCDPAGYLLDVITAMEASGDARAVAWADQLRDLHHALRKLEQHP